VNNSYGIHHISAIVSDPQKNVDFYAGVLGLRMVKKTVNFDDPYTYHLYFGNYEGGPGTLITFFPWPLGLKGKVGGGQVISVQYKIPVNAMEFWKSRLKSFDINFKTEKRFNQTYLVFQDNDGLIIELTESEKGQRNQYSFNGITENEAIKGFEGATLASRNPLKSVHVLTEYLGFKVDTESDNRIRLITQNVLGNVIEIFKIEESLGKMGVGTIHHIAFRTTSEDSQKTVRELLLSKGYKITPIIDRNYFKSVYFREPGSILFEIATDEPGFTIDEPIEHLGASLKIPKHHQALKDEIENHLLPISVREVKANEFNHKSK
jgi:glyoxalase family protein